MKNDMPITRFPSAVFWGFCVLVAIVFVAVLRLNPSADDPQFILQVVVMLGGLGLMGAFAARRLAQGKGLVAASVLTGFLTQAIVVGWLSTGSLQIHEDTHPLLHFLRTVSGVYVVIMWLAIGAAVRERHFSR